MPKSISYTVSDYTAESLAKVGKNPNWTSKRASESWNILKISTLAELKGIFTKNELIGLIDRTNGLLFEPRFCTNSSFLITGMKDACTYEGTDTNHNFDINILTEKLQKLTSAQIFFLQEWADCFWIADSNRDLGKYVEELL